MVDHAVDGTQDDREGLVDKDEDHGDLGQLFRVGYLLAPARGTVVSEGPEGLCPVRGKGKAAATSTGPQDPDGGQRKCEEDLVL